MTPGGSRPSFMDTLVALLAGRLSTVEAVADALAGASLRKRAAVPGYVSAEGLLRSEIEKAVGRQRWPELKRLLETVLTDGDLTQALTQLSQFQDLLDRSEAPLQVLIALLRRGSFRRAASHAARLASDPDEPANEFRVASDALEAMCHPWPLLAGALDPRRGYSQEALSERGHPASAAARAVGDLSLARVLFRNRWGCDDAEREADLLCFRLRFALARHTGRPFAGVAPYQSIAWYLRTGHRATAGRLLLLWAAGLIWEATEDRLLDGLVDLDPAARDQIRPAVSLVGLAVAQPEIRQAALLLREFRTPERPIEDLLAALAPALRTLAKVDDPAQPHDVALDLPDRALYEVSEIEPRLVRGLLEPHLMLRRGDLPLSS